MTMIQVPQVREIIGKMQDIREAYAAAVPLPRTLHVCQWINERLAERFGEDAPTPVELDMRRGETTMILEHAELSPDVTMRITISITEKALVIFSTIDGAGSRIVSYC